ncbi:hypothetical protein RB200_35890 [Streptomyces sp. PmtG]
MSEASVKKSVLAGIKWGTVAVLVAIPVRSLVYDEPALSATHAATFVIVGVASAAATFYSGRRHADESS